MLPPGATHHSWDYPDWAHRKTARDCAAHCFSRKFRRGVLSQTLYPYTYTYASIRSPWCLRLARVIFHDGAWLRRSTTCSQGHCPTFDAGTYTHTRSRGALAMSLSKPSQGLVKAIERSEVGPVGKNVYYRRLIAKHDGLERKAARFQGVARPAVSGWWTQTPDPLTLLPTLWSGMHSHRNPCSTVPTRPDIHEYSVYLTRDGLWRTQRRTQRTGLLYT